MKRVNSTYYKIHCLKYRQLTSISCFSLNMKIFFSKFNFVEKLAYFDKIYQISVKINQCLSQSDSSNNWPDHPGHIFTRVSNMCPPTTIFAAFKD